MRSVAAGSNFIGQPLFAAGGTVINNELKLESRRG
jgi:hypothetical protein